MADKVTRLTVDVVVSDGTKVVLIQRKNEPFQGAWALPGGFVDYGETVEQAALREVKEETGLDVGLVSASKSLNANLVQPAHVHLDHIKDDHKHINLMYFAVVKGG